jgi:hypothetical protein
MVAESKERPQLEFLLELFDGLARVRIDMVLG